MSSEIAKLLALVQTETGAAAWAAAAATAAEPTGQRVAGVARTGVGPIDAALDLADVTAARPVVELVGAPGSGKTQTMYRISATVAMNGAHVLFVDASGTADVRLLARSMRGAAGATDALRRVHLFAPGTTAALVATLAMLPAYVSERGIAAAALVVDGLGSQLWIDRRESALLRLQIKRATPWFRQQQQLVDTLYAVCGSLGCVAFAANTLLLRDSAHAARSAAPNDRTFAVGDHRFRDHMIARWQAVVARTFVLENAPCPDRPDLTRITFQTAGHPARPAHIGPHGLQDQRSSDEGSA
ncbi:hypothetical protein H4R19_004709 [Coemansia spiralis]|nr:hypothetical protein H4R19_004709 [Coemansia spiralis]